MTATRRKDGFTKAQLKAIAFLPADGTWTPCVRRSLPQKISAAVGSLTLYHPHIARMEKGNLRPRGGFVRRARLTAEGVEMRAKLGT